VLHPRRERNPLEAPATGLAGKDRPGNAAALLGILDTGGRAMDAVLELDPLAGNDEEGRKMRGFEHHGRDRGRALCDRRSHNDDGRRSDNAACEEPEERKQPPGPLLADRVFVCHPANRSDRSWREPGPVRSRRAVVTAT
jgi:hypothetical protein